MSSLHPDDERLSRDWVEAFRGNTGHTEQVSRSYLRFLQRARPSYRQPPMAQIAGWVLVGVVVGMSSVYAATGPLQRWWQREPLVEPRASLVPVDTATNPQPTLLQRTEVDAPPPAPSAPVLPPSALSGPAPSSSSAAAAAAREEWQRAARGLRERDFDTANRALEELVHSASGAERESAQLVQAQLLLSQGREADAVNVLRVLLGSAHSPSVRQKSSDLLKRVETPPSQRSFAPAEGANGP
ncbi:MAG: hypothetical protein ABUL60_25290 [Myxococcales bacterium]